MSLLQTEGLTKHFGGLAAVENVNMDVASRGVRALIGPNGAGKTTFVSLICGRLAPTSGVISFDGRDITTMPAHKRVALGIAYTFQITSIYARLTVLENVALAAHRGRTDPLSALARVGLSEEADHIAGALSYGHQRLLEVAMGLALDPRLLILDEPTQGLANAEIDAFNEIVLQVAKDASVLLIEHNMDVVMELADRITVLDFGRVLAEGAPDVIRADAAVQAAYLGA